MNRHTEFRIELYHVVTFKSELDCIVSPHWGISIGLCSIATLRYENFTVLYRHSEVRNELYRMLTLRYENWTVLFRQVEVKIEVFHMITLMYMNLIASYRHKVCWFFQASIYEPCIEKCMNHMNEKDTQPYLLSYFSSRFWKTFFFF